MASQLNQVWNALRAQNPQRRSALLEVRIRRLRGILDLRIPFDYPVCVLAGPNGCGKSTVLFACACAYEVPGRGPRDFAPSSLFPNFIAPQPNPLSDVKERTELQFFYLHENERLSMAWKRHTSWSRSYMGRKKGRQPKRNVYLRTLANLTNPSEVRGLLQLARKQYQTTEVTQDLLVFAHRILRQRYRNLSIIASETRDLLFARTEGDMEMAYSEFHMSSGERMVLRISKDISRLRESLILIDEVDTGLHPYTQQQLMLELQRLALRNDLQIIVSSHSPVVLDSVPPDARIFLDRDDRTADVVRLPPYRNLFQRALYGQSRDRLSMLCEDDTAEGLLLGILDVVNPRLDLRHEDIVVGRNTGRSEFQAHVRTLGKFGKLNDVIVILDGDARTESAGIERAAHEFGHPLTPLFLPGNEPPERWLWRVIGERTADYATLLGAAPADLTQRMQDIERMLAGQVHRHDGAKAAMAVFAEEQGRTIPELARIVGRREAEAGRPDVAAFRMELEARINAWREL